MKNVFLFLLQIPLFTYAQSFLQVYDNGKVLYPENFLNSNGIVQVDATGVLTHPSNFLTANGLVQVDSNGVFKYPSDLLSKNGIMQVDSAGSLLAPSKATFFEKNVKVFQQDFRIYIDTTPSPQENYMQYGTTTVQSNPFYYRNSNNTITRTVTSSGTALNSYSSRYLYYKMCWWTDGEIKVIDKWGNLVFFTSTIALSNIQVQMLHPELCDSTPKIYAWKGDYTNDTGGCWGRKVQHTNFNASIGSSIGSAITGIWIYPSIDSTQKRNIPIYTGANIYTYKTVVWGNYIREIFNNPDNTILVWRQTTSAGELYNGNKLWRPARLEYYGDFKEVKK